MKGRLHFAVIFAVAAVSLFSFSPVRGRGGTSRIVTYPEMCSGGDVEEKEHEGGTGSRGRGRSARGNENKRGFARTHARTHQSSVAASELLERA